MFLFILIYLFDIFVEYLPLGEMDRISQHEDR